MRRSFRSGFRNALLRVTSVSKNVKSTIVGLLTFPCFFKFKRPVEMLDNSQAIYRLEPMVSYDFKSRQGRLRLETR